MEYSAEHPAGHLLNAPLERWPAALWDMLAAAVGNPADPWRTPIIASAGPAGPEARVVILRQVHAEERRLAGFTDARSAKVEQLRRDPRVAWTFYNPGQGVQLRLRGEVALHVGDELARACWDGVSGAARSDYLGKPGPGRRVDAPGSGQPDPMLADAAEAGLANFLVMDCTVWAMDCLCLAPQGHRRARFQWTQGRWSGEWLCP